MTDLKKEFNELTHKQEHFINELLGMGDQYIKESKYKQAISILRQALHLCIIYDNFYYYNEINNNIKTCEIELLKNDRNIIEVTRRTLEGV